MAGQGAQRCGAGLVRAGPVMLRDMLLLAPVPLHCTAGKKPGKQAFKAKQKQGKKFKGKQEY